MNHDDRMSFLRSPFVYPELSENSPSYFLSTSLNCVLNAFAIVAARPKIATHTRDSRMRDHPDTGDGT